MPWACSACTLINQDGTLSCEVCETARPPTHTAAPTPGGQSQVDVAGMSVKELKAFLTAHHVAHADCVEKSDLRQRYGKPQLSWSNANRHEALCVVGGRVMETLASSSNSSDESKECISAEAYYQFYHGHTQEHLTQVHRVLSH